MENRVWNSFTVCALVIAFALCNSATASSEIPQGETTEHTTQSAVVPTTAVTPPPVNSMPETTKTTVNNDTNSKLSVDIYYEGLCNDSVNFVVKQFTPAYEKLNKYLAVTFIPFSQGKIVEPTDNTTESKLVCVRNGECNADIVHTCGIKYITKQDDLVKFVTCALTEGMKNITDNSLVEKCATTCNIDNATVSLINGCVSDIKQYLPLLEVDSKLAKKENVTYVPTIVFNKVYSDETQKLAESKFLNAVCGAIKDKDSPAECKAIDSGSDTIVVGILPILIGVYYFIRMF